MIMKRYVAGTGKKSFLTLPSALGLERAAVPVRWEWSAVAVMPAS
jgi:hypothetical protein